MDNKKSVEIARSYSQKVNLGNYETCDFFMSCKAEVPFEDAESVSEELYHFCRKIVQRDIENYLANPQKVKEEEYFTPNYKPKSWCKDCKATPGLHDCDNCPRCGTDESQTALVGAIEDDRETFKPK